MKTLRFSKFFIPAVIISGLIIISCVVGLLTKGFALGVDFQAGLIQEVQFAPSAFSLKWSGTSNAIISFDRQNIHIVISGSGIENRTYTFPFSEYTTVNNLTAALKSQLGNDLEVVISNPQVSTDMLVFSSQGNPYLNDEVPYVVHYLNPQSRSIEIAEVRDILEGGIDSSISVQSIGAPSDRHFMIRITEEDEYRSINPAEVVRLLETLSYGEVALLRSDYVGSRFSKNLTDQAGILLGLTLLLILIYASIRFKPQFAVGAVMAIINDGIVIVSFVIWTQMEFSTTTIAAILTILGYSINNTIVIFDRVRETRKISADEPFINILNKSLSDMLGRSVITTVTTILAILFLFIFAAGAMQNFALTLMVGMVSGLFTSLFIAPGIVYFLERIKNKK